jgi:hypothetical protein
MPDPKQLFFVRQGITVPLRLLGKKITFEDFGADVGGLFIIEDANTAPYVTALREAIQNQIGGLTEVTEEGYLAAKKAASDARKMQEQRAAQSSIGNPFGQDPRLAASPDPFGNRTGAPPVERIDVSMPSSPTLAPVAEADPSRVYLVSQNYPKPATNEEYKQLYGGQSEAPAPAAEAVASAPTAPPKRGKASALKG